MHRRLLLGQLGGASVPHNLELEGDLTSITTNVQLATFLGVSVNKIRTFTNTGSLIQASIRGNYNIPANQFANNTSLTKLKDIGGVIDNVGNNGLRNTQLEELLLPNVTTFTETASIAYNTKLTTINLPKLIRYGSQSLRGNTSATHYYLPSLESVAAVTLSTDNFFSNLSSLELFDAKKLKIYGNPASGYSATASGFSLLKLGCVMNVNIALATANNGEVDEAFRYCKAVRGAIVNFYDDNGNYVSTL